MEEEIDLKEIFKYFFEKKIFIILVIIFCGVFGIIYSKFIVKPKYEASTTIILVENKSEKDADVDSYFRLVDVYKGIVNSNTVLLKAVKNLKLDLDIKDFKEKKIIEVETSAVSQSININVVYIDSAEAVKIANEISKVFIEEIKRIYNDERLLVLDEAVIDDEPINVDLIETTIKFIVIGAVLVSGIVFIMYFIDKNKEINKENN